jgi:hypothetical protein
MGARNNPKPALFTASKDNLSLFNNSTTQLIKMNNAETKRDIPPNVLALYHISLFARVFLILNPYTQLGGIFLIIRGIEITISKKETTINEIIGLSLGSMLIL